MSHSTAGGLRSTMPTNAGNVAIVPIFASVSDDADAAKMVNKVYVAEDADYDLQKH